MESRNPILLMARALISVIDGADVYSRGRSLRIARYSVRVGKQLGLSDRDLENIELGALLHDLGRNAILNDVLLRPRPLDAGERALVQTHPTIGWELIKDIPGLETAAEIVHSHHERPDGKGYPRGLKNDAIPNGARIIMVCAAFDAMTEDRPYRRGLPSRAACEELHRNAGTQFFRDVVGAFIQLHDSGRLWEDFTREEMDLYVRRSGVAAA
jgi:HD-GYP domain-containing protein (c-di-GMP phosphodiesterase class II)